MISDTDLLACAVEAAARASSHALANTHRRGEVAAAYRHDIKLDLDAECQRVATDVILAAYPSHPVLGEEDASFREGPTGTEYRWIVDPIDGTVNFAHGLPLWCCAIAVQYRGATVAACVAAPALGRRFTATASSPALCNDEPIGVSTVGTLGEAMVMTGVDDLALLGYARRELFARIADRAQKVRVMGCAALDMCRVAAGEADGYFESGVYLWDVEAAGLITRRAGGRAEIVRQLDRPHYVSYVASNGRIHEALRDLTMAEPSRDRNTSVTQGGATPTDKTTTAG